MKLGHPWVCPRCDRVYGPMALECDFCNIKIFEKERASDSISFEDYASQYMKQGMGHQDDHEKD